MRTRTSGAALSFAVAVLTMAAGLGSGIASPALAGEARLAVLSVPAEGAAAERRVVVVPAPNEPESAPGPATDPTVRAKGKTTITYLFAYTKKARKASPNIVREARALIAWMNRAFKNSGVKIRFKMVKPLLVKNYNEASKTFSDSLNELRFGPELARVREARDQRRADIVTLIRENTGQGPGVTCSIVFITDKPSSQTADQAVSVISRIPSSDCDLGTFASTFGSMMGLKAERFVEPKASNKKFNFGFVNVPARIRTIMTTDAKCAAAGRSCEEIQAFSTPKRRYRGNRIGVAKGKPGAADNARQLNNNRAVVAAYR